MLKERNGKVIVLKGAVWSASQTGRTTADELKQYNLYKRLQKQWEEVGNKKMAGFFAKRMRELEKESLLKGGLLG